MSWYLEDWQLWWVGELGSGQELCLLIRLSLALPFQMWGLAKAQLSDHDHYPPLGAKAFSSSNLAAPRNRARIEST